MKNHVLKTFVISVLIISFAIPVYAASTTLNVSEIDQNKTKWCWAACSEMIGKYYNSESGRDQYDIVKKIKGNTNNQGGSMSDIRKAIKYASVSSVTFKEKYSALSFSSCKTEINDDNPFVIWLQSTGASLSHVVVASGYKIGNKSYIYVLDPNPNIDGQYFLYTGLVNGTTGTLGTCHYEKTILKK